MAAVMAATPWRARSLATKAIRRMFSSRSSREKPRPLVRRRRTSSPSSTSTGHPRSRSSRSSRRARVLLPALGNPVNQTTNPSPISRRTPLHSSIGECPPGLLDVSERAESALCVAVQLPDLLRLGETGRPGHDVVEEGELLAQGQGWRRGLDPEIGALQRVALEIVVFLAAVARAIAMRDELVGIVAGHVHGEALVDDLGIERAIAHRCLRVGEQRREVPALDQGWRLEADQG